MKGMLLNIFFDTPKESNDPSTLFGTFGELAKAF